MHSNPVNILHTSNSNILHKWTLPDNDALKHCDNLHICRWVSVNRQHFSFRGTEDECISYVVQHYAIHSPSSCSLGNPSVFSNYIHTASNQKQFSVIYYFINPLSDFYLDSLAHHLTQHREIFKELVTVFQPIGMVFVKPMHQNTIQISEEDLWNMSISA